MRRTKRMLVICSIAVAALFFTAEEPVLAACGPAVLASGSTCGCEGWMTIVWDGAYGNCAGDDTENGMCAAAWCNLECGESFQGHTSCQNNQWSSWIGFRCGNFFCPIG